MYIKKCEEGHNLDMGIERVQTKRILIDKALLGSRKQRCFACALAIVAKGRGLPLWLTRRDPLSPLVGRTGSLVAVKRSRTSLSPSCWSLAAILPETWNCCWSCQTKGALRSCWGCHELSTPARQMMIPEPRYPPTGRVGSSPGKLYSVQLCD